MLEREWQIMNEGKKLPPRPSILRKEAPRERPGFREGRRSRVNQREEKGGGKRWGFEWTMDGGAAGGGGGGGDRQRQKKGK